jgi:GNAT superfamily N-acetyltransferase
MITRLDHVQLAMPSGGEDRARAFFAGILGMVEEPKPAPLAGRGGCWFRTSGVLVHMGVEKAFAPQLKAHPAFCVSGIEAAAAKLAAAGFPVEWDDSLAPRRRLYTADPFGNRIELIRDGDGFGQPAAFAPFSVESPDGAHFVSTAPDLIDLDFVCRLLATTYWASDRPRAVIEASVASSLCFGVYGTTSKEQVGLARLVTDGATFSWLCDVGIDSGHQGKGLGKFLMDSLMTHPVVKATKVVLATRDAHGLYERHGFVRFEMMRRPQQP